MKIDRIETKGKEGWHAYFEKGKASYAAHRSPMIRSMSDQVSEFYEDALILLETEGERAGRIVAIGDAQEVAEQCEFDLASIPVEASLLMPAFFDPHFHWVQDDVREMPKSSLIEWLNQYTFPEESKYGDRDFAQKKAARFWERILSVGTIGGLCYSSIHEGALEEAFRYAPEDFYIGNVLMTMNCPDNIRQSIEDASRSVETCAARYGSRYVATPRFAPTTDPLVMKASARVAAQCACFQQTHLSETTKEIDWVLEMYREIPGFEDVRHYTDIYQRVGMLGSKTIFGHCIYLEDAEWLMLAESGSRIASCPTSNAPLNQLGLGSGLFDFRKAEHHDILWALASDIGGGPFLSMFDVMRSFVKQNAAAGIIGATYSKALHRSTVKGAAMLNLGEVRGRLEVGYYFDAIRVELPAGDFRTGNAEPVIKAVVESIPSRQATDDIVLETFIKGASRYKS